MPGALTRRHAAAGRRGRSAGARTPHIPPAGRAPARSAAPPARPARARRPRWSRRRRRRHRAARTPAAGRRDRGAGRGPPPAVAGTGGNGMAAQRAGYPGAVAHVERSAPPAAQLGGSFSPSDRVTRRLTTPPATAPARNGASLVMLAAGAAHQHACAASRLAAEPSTAVRPAAPTLGSRARWRTQLVRYAEPALGPGAVRRPAEQLVQLGDQLDLDRGDRQRLRGQLGPARRAGSAVRRTRPPPALRPRHRRRPWCGRRCVRALSAISRRTGRDGGPAASPRPGSASAVRHPRERRRAASRTPRKPEPAASLAPPASPRVSAASWPFRSPESSATRATSSPR